jgi:hypothetical protein
VGDNLLGWTHRPKVRVTHPSFEFRATYETDESARRVTGYDGTEARLVLLGCSWAFGHGVDDHETFGAMLANHHGVPSLNYACMGYGPAHGYLQLANRTDLGAVSCDGCEVCYIWVPDQLMRAWRRREWIQLNSWVNPDGPSHPVFDLRNGVLHYGGLIHEAEGVSDPLLLPGLVQRLEWATTVALLRAMRDSVASTGRHFSVVIPIVPDTPNDQVAACRMVELLHRAAVPCIDLNSLRSAHRLVDTELFFRFDGHPRPAWHQLTATGLVDHLLR